MNIYDIDGISERDVNGADVKIFYKDVYGDELLRVVAGCDGRGSVSKAENVYLAFEVKNLNKPVYCTNTKGDHGEDIARIVFSLTGNNELVKTIQALEFALGVLRQGLDKDIPF